MNDETKTNEILGGNQLARAQQSVVSRFSPPVWDDERVALAKKAVTPVSATQAEFEFFIAWCRRTGLDPFVKQAYLIERWDAQTNTRRHEPMAAEQGMAAKADAEPDYRGMKSGVVYAGDKFGVDEESQKVTHTWSPEDRLKGGMKILGAWAHGRRDGREVEITYLTLSSRIALKKDGSPTRFWANDPAGQLRKCARADQYRRLYPNLFAGVYIDAEMRNLDGDVTPRPVAVTPQNEAQMLAALQGSIDAVQPKPRLLQVANEPTPTPDYGPDGAPLSERARLEVAVEEASDETSLTALVERIAKLQTADKAALRKRWGERRDELRATSKASPAAVEAAP
jgi:phage recombination protein Bet